MTVERVRAGEVLRLERRAVAIGPQEEYVEIGVRSFGRGIFHKDPVDGASLGNKRVFRIEPDDLVISNVFAWEGAIAVASYADAGTIGSHRFMTFVPTDDRIDIGWASWFFRSEPGLELIRRASPGSAGRNRTLAIERFEALEIPLPPMDEQRRIAARLGDVQAAATGLRESVEHAVTLDSALEVSAVTRRDLTDEAKTASGWERAILGDVLTERLHAVPVEAHRTYQVAGVYSFGRGIFQRTELGALDTRYRALHRLCTGQVVMSRLKAWEGAIAVVPDAYDGWFLSPEFPTFDIDTTRTDIAYLEALLTSEQFWTRLAGASRGIGARRERVHADRLLEQEVELPPLAAQRMIARTLGVISDVRTHRSGLIHRIDALLPAALNEAFHGVS